MNFFEQQDQARRQTRTLVFLFALAVLAIVIAVNIVAALVWTWGHPSTDAADYPRGFFLANTLITIGLLVGGTLVEIYNLRDGGEAVAQMAGGRMVSPATGDLQERRLLNVVEEMALASGIACPKVYLLDREESINAFAAGYNPNEAVVAVTKGALQRLTRDELQGVVGHEFSHILNGDMRLNVRLIGVLFGIQMIHGFGRQLLDFASHMGRSKSRDDKGPSLQAIMLVLGVSLFVIGYIGVFFGRLIKSAVSRQREFLADASAVQFTRNPDGIGNALRKIGGLSRKDKTAARIAHPNAEHLSHLFLSAVRPNLLSGLFATHPPIPERLRRIFGKGVDLLEAPVLDELASAPALPDIAYVAPRFAGAAIGAAAPAMTAAHAVLPADATLAPAEFRWSPQLENALHEPQAAAALVQAMFIEPGADVPTVAPAQTAVLQEYTPQQATFITYLAESIWQLPQAARLPLLDLAMPALRQLSQNERDRLLLVADKLIAADNRVTLAEFVLETVLSRRLAQHAGRAVPVKFASIAPLGQECCLLLSLVAHVSVIAARRQQNQTETAAFAFMRGAAQCVELKLAATDLLPVAQIHFANIRQALDRTNQLAPLAKPQLIKALQAVAIDGSKQLLPIELAEVLRAICAALEAPMPPAVKATYAASGFAHVD